MEKEGCKEAWYTTLIVNFLLNDFRFSCVRFTHQSTREPFLYKVISVFSMIVNQWSKEYVGVCKHI